MDTMVFEGSDLERDVLSFATRLALLVGFETGNLAHPCQFKPVPDTVRYENGFYRAWWWFGAWPKSKELVIDFVSGSQFPNSHPDKLEWARVSWQAGAGTVLNAVRQGVEISCDVWMALNAGRKVALEVAAVDWK